MKMMGFILLLGGWIIAVAGLLVTDSTGVRMVMALVGFNRGIVQTALEHIERGAKRSGRRVEDLEIIWAARTGMAATTALTQLLLKQGDHAICSDNVYGGTFRLFDKIVRHYGVDFTYVNTSNLRDVESAMRTHTNTPRQKAAPSRKRTSAIGVSASGPVDRCTDGYVSPGR